MSCFDAMMVVLCFITNFAGHEWLMIYPNIVKIFYLSMRLENSLFKDFNKNLTICTYFYTSPKYHFPTLGVQ
jgi:hypothetical protein